MTPLGVVLSTIQFVSLCNAINIFMPRLRYVVHPSNSLNVNVQGASHSNT
jgi:hypothetical protein